MNPLISIIVATYNRPYALADLLHSLSLQTYKNFEVVIVNDAGADVSFVLDLYTDLSIQYFNLPENKKSPTAKNFALQHAKGKLLMLIDDDDFLLPNHIETMLRTMKSSGADFVYSDCEIFDYDLVDGVRRPTHKFLFAFEPEPSYHRETLLAMTLGCLYKRSVHHKIGLFDISLDDYWEWDFFLRVLDTVSIKRSPYATGICAYSLQGDNKGYIGAERGRYLKRFIEKHKLKNLHQSNFYMLLMEPEIVVHRAKSTRFWNGNPIVSRLVDPAIDLVLLKNS